MKRSILALAIVLLVGLGLFFTVIPTEVGKRMNPVHKTGGEGNDGVSAEALSLHKTLFVADLHADTLLWNRDLLARGSWGHVDLPRLQEGNVAFQNFTVVTRTPRNMNIESNNGGSDNITLLALAERWPVATWGSLLERALYQARRLDEAAARSNGQLLLIRSRSDLETFLARRKVDAKVVAGMLGLEGAHALEGKAANLDKLYDAGFRTIGITHFFDNEMGGSAHGALKPGLTEEGREMVKRAQSKRLFIDLAHASPRVIDDVLAFATRPVIVSHTGLRATCDNTRNLSDAQLKAIAATGGIVGIGFWDTAVCGESPADIARAIRHAVNTIGAGHVALGSDFDGAVGTSFDASGLARITQALIKEGLTEEEIRLIMGENVLKLFYDYL